MITPAIISLTTCDWPRRLKMRPTTRQTPRMKASCRKKRTDRSKVLIIRARALDAQDRAAQFLAT